MKSLRKIFFFSILLYTQKLFSLPFEMIPADDPVLEDLRYISMESGIPFLSFTPPLSPDEIEQFLNSLDIEKMSLSAKNAYSRIKNRLILKAPLSFTSNTFSIFFNISSTLETRARFSKDISWEQENTQVPPLLSIPIRSCFFNFFQLYVEPILAVNPVRYINTERFGVNVPYSYDHFELNMPLRAFVAAGASWWNFQLGRDRLFWGTGHTGSLSFSGNSAFSDFMRLSIFSKFFKYSLLISQMPLQITGSLYPNFNQNQNSMLQTTMRYFYLHRIDASFFGKISLSVMEGIMAGNSGLELRFLNPLAIFHSFFSWLDYDLWTGGSGEGSMIGSFFSAELNWNIYKNLAFYAQFVMNEIAISSESNSGNVEPPNSLGYLTGLNFTHSFDTWASIFFLEFIYTDPYCYMLSSPFASFIQMRRISPDHVQYYYMGYPRDTIAITIGAKFFTSEKLSLTGSISLISRGEHNKGGLIWDWEKTREAFEAKTPTGTTENRLIATMGARWKPLPYLVICGNLSGIFSKNNKHQSGEDKFGGQAMVSVGFQL